MECNTILERVERRAKEKCTRDVLGDTAIGAGESATRSRSVGFNKSTQRAIHRKTRCKETFVNVRTQRRKGKVTTSPKVKVKARARENIQERETATRTQAGSPDEETGQRTLGDFVIKHKRVELVGDVQRMMILRVTVWIEQLMYFAVKSVTVFPMGPTELPSSSKRVSDGNEESAGTHEKFDRSTGEVLLAVGCRDDRPIVDSGSVVSTCPADFSTSVPTEKVQYSMNLENVLGESLQHCDIKRNVPFTNRSGSSINVNFDVTDTKRQ